MNSLNGPQHDTGKQGSNYYPAKVPLQIRGCVVASPDSLTAKVNLVPQLDNLVSSRQAKHDRRGKERSQFEWQPVTKLLQQAIDEPDDHRADEHLHRHV